MSFSNPLLKAHLKTGRVAHTYLFTGTEGPAKDEMVLAFARALNCEKSSDPVCDCAPCRKIGNRNHPDVRWLGADEKARSIKIEEIRELIHQSTLKPYEGKWKVFILKGAERLTLEAANALLKTLEEPPAHSVFILLVENKAHLLETIQSRGFEVRNPPLPEKDPRESEKIQLLEKSGWNAYFEGLRADSRQELQADLETLLLYLRDGSVLEWERRSNRSKQYLDALDSVYETQEALDANVNQKLAVTHLEIQLGKILSE